MKMLPGGVTAPKGFQASGVHCGVKKGKGDGNQPPMSKMPEVLEGKKDLALILSERECTAAAVYTLNRVKAAPLYVTMDHLENGEARASWPIPAMPTPAPPTAMSTQSGCVSWPPQPRV